VQAGNPAGESRAPQRRTPPRTFAEWIDLEQGAGVAKHFMHPYNTKLWTVAPDAMGWDWMADLVPFLGAARDPGGAGHPSGPEDRDKTFDYPRRGAGDLALALAARICPTRFGTRLVALKPRDHVAVLDDGQVVRYEALVSTIPLTKLGAMLAPLPSLEQGACSRLESVDLLVVDVGFAAPGDSCTPWVYFPDPEVLAYRLHLVHALSRSLMPPGCGLYCLEVSHSPRRPLPAGELRPRLVADLVRTRWLQSPEQVVFYRERRFPCSYVIPRLGSRQDAALLRDYARRWDIHSIGRFGEWKYSCQEDALLDG
jgi:protoporphyrinogen oxidase